MASNSDTAAPDLIKQMKTHQTAVAELKSLPSSRAVYQKNGNIFFRTSLEKATVSEQRQLDAAKATLERSNLP